MFFKRSNHLGVDLCFTEELYLFVDHINNGTALVEAKELPATAKRTNIPNFLPSILTDD